MTVKLKTPSNGSVSLTPQDTASDVVLTVPAATGTVITTASTFAGTGPAFSAYQNVAQNITNQTDTKVNLQAEDYDTANCFASSRFTPNVAGYYQINGAAMVTVGASGFVTAQLFKNGILVKFGARGTTDGSNAWGEISTLVYLNGATDYVELYVYQDSGGARNMIAAAPYTWMNGFLARAA